MANFGGVTQIGSVTYENLTVPDTQGRKVTYEPWTDGYAIGFKVTRDDGKVDYIYLVPSNNEDGSDEPNVFIYSGHHGDPAHDMAHVHVCQFDD